MITREVGGRLVCVRQTDHAAAAGRIAEAWGDGGTPALFPRDPVVSAISHHDDGWTDIDEAPAFDPETGAPVTYRTRSLEARLEVARGSVERAARIHPYAAWLVSRHFASFHAGRDEPERVRWVVSQIGRRARWLAEARPEVGREALHPHVLEANLDRLQLLDAVSLAVCEVWERWESRPMATGYGERVGTWHWTRVPAGSGTRLAVEGRLEPWPFEADRVEVPIPVRVLPATRWDGPEPLAEAWSAARRATVEAALVRG